MNIMNVWKKTKWRFISYNDFLLILTLELNHLYGDIVLEMSGSVPVISLFNRIDIEKVRLLVLEIVLKLNSILSLQVLEFPSKFPFRFVFYSKINE